MDHNTQQTAARVRESVGLGLHSSERAIMGTGHSPTPEGASAAGRI